MQTVTVIVPPGDTNVTVIVQAATPDDVPARLTALETHVNDLDTQIAANKAATDAEQVELDAAVARETTDFASMTTQITTLTDTVATLTAAVNAGSATPAQLQSLADIQAANVAMTAQLKNLDPAVVLPPPTPPVDPNAPPVDPNAPPANPPTG